MIALVGSTPRAMLSFTEAGRVACTLALCAGLATTRVRAYCDRMTALALEAGGSGQDGATPSATQTTAPAP